ncbi:MAG: motB [Phycisphaerales bacterium]|jgi:flagellar motor protein MotB|nr:motB [Phycisphaerales bacterium]MDB5300073.1 motB [Phycisphaerales bacterium]MDB5304068.1 motB [Phycisphaerales bacterium]
MAKNSCKCKKSEECEECPEWIFTFADLVMLMMGFFVILWVLKPPAGKDAKDQEAVEAQKKWDETVGQIRKSFGYMPDPNSTDPVDVQMLKDKTPRGMRKGAETEEPRDGAVGTDHATTTIRPGKQSAIGGRLGFDPGNATLLPETTRALDQIADKIRGHYNIVLVKGHATLDDLPEGSTSSQRMELSLRRAQASADYLASRGVQSEILRVVGCSTFEPIKQRAYGADLQAMNRRVEVEVTAELLESRQDRAHVPALPSVPQAAAPLGPQARNAQSSAIH